MLSDSVLGIIGGGQLGRMLAMEARRMNIRTVVWTGGLESPAREIADDVVDLPFDDPLGLEEFCKKATVATVEFENIPADVLESVDQRISLNPSPKAVSICQNRLREKQFLGEAEIPCTPYALVESATDLELAIKSLGEGVLKTADFGYDGHGQIRIRGGEDAQVVWDAFESDKAVYEQWVPFEKEVSVMVARGADGEMVSYDVSENGHRNHILDVSAVPAQVDDSVAAKARDLAGQIADALDYCGIMGVEFFVKPGGELLVNEMAPRPHNSGHYTMDACETSQFEQQLRAVMGLPLGSTKLLSPVVMLNLLGDMWLDAATAPDWSPLFADGSASLHLYGKAQAKGRRKMGHANFLGASVDDAMQRALVLKDAWLKSEV